MLTPEQIANLPSDTKKEYLRTMLLLDEKKKEEAIRNDFLTFVKHLWPDFIEGEHHKIMSEKFNKVASGEIKRLIINMAPRHTKSEFASNFLPAWMIGKQPNLKIIQAFTSFIKVDKIELKKIPNDLKDHSDIIFEFKFLCISIENYSHLKNIFSKNNLEIKNTFCSSVVRSFNYINNFKNEKYIAFLDIGFLRSSLILFRDGSLHLFKNIPIGGQSITKDISYIMKIDLKDSEEIKHLFNKSETDFSYSNEIKQNEDNLKKKLITKKISIDLLKKVILARVEEIFNLLFEDVKISETIDKDEILLVLIGGGAKLFDKNSFNFESSNNFKDIIFYDETDKEICKSGLEYALKYNLEKENFIKNNKNKGIFERFFNLFQKI